MLISEIEDLSDKTADPTVAEAIGKMTELMRINQQLQGIYAMHLLTALKQSEMEIDDQLNEIASYMESIIASRRQAPDHSKPVHSVAPPAFSHGKMGASATPATMSAVVVISGTV